MPADIPPLIQPLLDGHVQRIQKTLPDFLTGFYLHGSIALGAFNERMSDIDFIVVICRRCTESDFQRLTEIHKETAQAYPKWPLQGSYLQANNLVRFDDDVEPYFHYSDGTLEAVEHSDIDAVTWWLLKNKGITLVGEPAQNLPYTVDWDHLLKWMRDNLNGYWGTYTREPSRMAWLLSDYGIQWTVLGVLRQFYTFKERDITSKIGAGEYALKHMPESWHRIILEAMRIRQGDGRSLYGLRILRAIDAWRFLKLVMRYENERFG